MEVIVKKWGNGAAVRIPASIMAAAHIELEQAVQVREEQGCIVIEPVRRPIPDPQSPVPSPQSSVLSPQSLSLASQCCATS